MEYCKQQFPVVKCLETPDHKLSNYEIRYFLCSLNPVGFFLLFCDKLIKNYNFFYKWFNLLLQHKS